MKATDHPPLDELTERKSVTVEQHKLWLDSLLSEADHDEIDSLVAEIRETQTSDSEP